MKVLLVLGSIILVGLFSRIIYPPLSYLQFLSPQGIVSENALSGEYTKSVNKAFFNNKEVHNTIAKTNDEKQVLAATTIAKRIEVDLTNQRLYAFEGDNKVYDFPISSGKWGRTPTGTFHIWIKLRYTLMTGGSTALGTYYYLPNVPYTMFFYNDEVPKHKGFGIHGTYWHDNFGHPMSHGCINMKTEEVEQLYYWANPVTGESNSVHASADNPGTEITIYGTAPNE